MCGGRRRFADGAPEKTEADHWLDCDHRLYNGRAKLVAIGESIRAFSRGLGAGPSAAGKAPCLPALVKAQRACADHRQRAKSFGEPAAFFRSLTETLTGHLGGALGPVREC